MTQHRFTLTATLGKYLTRVLMLALLAVGIGTAPVFAQEAPEYEKIYFEAQEADKAADYQTAYDQFVKAADLAKKGGNQEMAMNAHYRAGAAAYRLKKLNETYQHFNSAYDLAKQIKNQDMVASTGKVLAQLDYARGKDALTAEKYEEALQHFEKGLAHSDQYPTNYYGKGLALKNLDRSEEAMAAFQQAIASGDRKVAETAKDAIRKEYIFLASSALARGGDQPSSSDAREAIQHLEAMKEFVEYDADAYYYLAEAHKALGEYDQAVAAADQGLELSQGSSRNEQAKFYFVKGEALMLKGDNAGARAAFSEARYGSYKAPAEHYIEVLGTN